MSQKQNIFAGEIYLKIEWAACLLWSWFDFSISTFDVLIYNLTP